MTVIIPVAIIACILAWLFRPRMGTFKARRVAIFATAIPLVILAIAALAFQLLQNATGNMEVSDISNICFIVGIGMIGATLLALLYFAVARKVETVKGLGFGLTIMVILSIVEFVFLEALAGV